MLPGYLCKSYKRTVAPVDAPKNASTSPQIGHPGPLEVPAWVHTHSTCLRAPSILGSRWPLACAIVTEAAAPSLHQVGRAAPRASMRIEPCHAMEHGRHAMPSVDAMRPRAVPGSAVRGIYKLFLIYILYVITMEFIYAL